jgi:hypothetical protein
MAKVRMLIGEQMYRMCFVWISICLVQLARLMMGTMIFCDFRSASLSDICFKVEDVKSKLQLYFRLSRLQILDKLKKSFLNDTDITSTMLQYPNGLSEFS